MKMNTYELNPEDPVKRSVLLDEPAYDRADHAPSYAGQDEESDRVFLIVGLPKIGEHA